MTRTTERATPEMPEPSPWKFTREEYYWLAENGFFGDEHVELIGGEIVKMVPIGPEQSATIAANTQTLIPAFGSGYHTRTQLPLSLEDSEPEPDIAVVKGNPADYKTEHPQSAVLVIEVSKTTLDYDRTHKSSLYARASIPDYWIVNLVDRCVEVYREPVEMAGAPFGWGYSSRTVYHSDEEIAPLEKPEVKIKVSSLLL